MKIQFYLNGEQITLAVQPEQRVIDVLREELQLTGTKEGCGSGECGACTILIDGKAHLACLMLAAQLHGRQVITIEGISEGEVLHPLQQAFVEHGAIQCGFCTAGMVLSASALLEQNAAAEEKTKLTRAAIREGLSGNLCRCGSYNMIIDAVEAAVNQEISALPQYPLPHRSNDSSLKTTNVLLPQTITELWDIYTQCTPHYLPTVFCGGTDLLVKHRPPLPQPLLCLERVAELKEIREQDDHIIIGAAATHNQMLTNTLILIYFPVLHQALQHLGSPQIRNMGTLGGNICTASPAGDCLPPLYVLNASLELQTHQTSNSTSIRRLPIREFILAPGKTALLEHEILTSVWIPKPSPNSWQHYEKVGKRNALACAVVSLATNLEVDTEGKILNAALAWGSVSPTVYRSTQIEELLIGQEISLPLLEKAAALVREQVTPQDDVRASAAYRRQIAGNILLRLMENIK